MFKKTNEYLHQINLYPKGTPLVKGGGRLTDLLYAANPVYLDVYQGESIYIGKPYSMLMFMALLVSLMCFGMAFTLINVAVEEFGLWSIWGGTFLGAAILTLLAFWLLIKANARYVVVFFYIMVAWGGYAFLVAFGLEIDEREASVGSWFFFYSSIVLALTIAVYCGLFGLSSVRSLTTPIVNIARFDRKHQKVFLMAEQVPIRFRDITLKTILRHQSVLLEIPWANLRPAIRHHSLLRGGRIFQGMFVEPKPGAWEGTEESLCMTNNALHMVKIGGSSSTGMTGTEPAGYEIQALEAIRRFMEEGQPPIMRIPRWRNFFRPNWQTMFGLYSSVEDWIEGSHETYPPLKLKRADILNWLAIIFIFALSLFAHSSLFVFGGVIFLSYNWLAISRAPYPKFPEKIRLMHKFDLDKLQIDAYGNPLDAHGNPLPPPTPPVPPANLSAATHKKLLLLDKVLAYIAFFFAALSPLLWFIILMPGFPNIFGDYELFSPYFSAAIAVCLARLSLPLARQIKPEGVWRPAVPSQETQPTAPPTLDDYLPEIVVHLKSEFRRIWFTYRKKQPSPKANPTDNAPPPQ